MLQFITNAPTISETVRQAKQAIEGGCRWIQIREKNASKSDVCDTLNQLVPYTRNSNVTLLVDDMVECAKLEGVAGVHLGQNDTPIEEARYILGNSKIIGLTVNTISQAQKAIETSADYVGIGPWRYTTTKQNLAPVLGVEGLTEIIKIIRRSKRYIPIVAIGGIVEDDIPDILGCGADGIAVSGQIAKSPNPIVETMKFLKTLKKYNQQNKL